MDSRKRNSVTLLVEPREVRAWTGLVGKLALSGEHFLPVLGL